MGGEVLLTYEQLLPSNESGPGWIIVADRLIASRGVGQPPREPDVAVQTLVPGFVDTHCHGASGIDFGTVGSDPQPALDFHHKSGSTSVMASLATGELINMAQRLRELAPLVRTGELLGTHLEGPFLSETRCGAHLPSLLRAPDPESVEQLLDAAEGSLTMVTLAPELVGGIDAVRRFREAGVTVAVGHTDASLDTVKAALDAGASVITHLYNGMPPLHHRSAGPVGVALTDERVTVELIVDGNHVEDTAIDVALRCAEDRLMLISDAMSATGLGDGRYELAGSEVLVRGGIARLADGSSLAGSISTVAEGAERILARGVDAEVMTGLTNGTPLRSLGRSVSRLLPGETADLVELRGGKVARVMRGGLWLV